MSKDVKYIKPKKFYEVFKEISEHLYDTIGDKKDRHLFYDREKWIHKNTMWNTYKSKDEFEKELVYNGDIETISILISQMVLFGRIIKERFDTEFNLSDNEVPLYHRQIDDNGTEEDLYDISSLKIMKKWSKSDKGRKKLREVSNQI